MKIHLNCCFISSKLGVLFLESVLIGADGISKLHQWPVVCLCVCLSTHTLVHMTRLVSIHTLPAPLIVKWITPCVQTEREERKAAEHKMELGGCL